MSRDKERPRDAWGLGESLHSPARNANGNRWGFWETLLRVEEGDSVLHLFGKDNPRFVGHSIAETDGYETSAKPSHSNYGYEEVNRLYRVHLRDFRRFDPPYPLSDLFEEREEEIIQYYKKNKDRTGSEKRQILPVLQRGRLQCLNGAYLSEADEEWREILFDFLDSEVDQSNDRSGSKGGFQAPIPTGTQPGETRRRVGQKKFSDEVRDNYNSICCFPGCEVSHHKFLVGAHIARWADTPELRGRVDNGLCLCLMHDKAFEYGWFTLTPNHEVWITEERVEASPWAQKHLLPWKGEKIDEAPTMPGDEPLIQHWERVGLYPEARAPE